MGKVSIEGGREISMSSAEALAYVGKRTRQFLTDQRSLRSLNLAEDIYFTVARQVPNFGDLRYDETRYTVTAALRNKKSAS